jgi:hypothetical protein
MRSVALRPSPAPWIACDGRKASRRPAQIGLFDGSVCGVYISAMGQKPTSLYRPARSGHADRRSLARRKKVTSVVSIIICQVRRPPVGLEHVFLDFV